MKTLMILALTFMVWSCQNANKQEAKAPDDHAGHQAVASSKKPSKSPRTAVMAMVAGNHVHIDYSSPSARGRQIFGGLVAFGEVWVTGAHKATNIKFDKDVKIGGTIVPQGKYGFFTIPGENNWTIILNSEWDMHLADEYDAAKDILRIDVAPDLLDEVTESLTYEVVEGSGNTGTISVAWDKTKVSFKFEVQ